MQRTKTYTEETLCAGLKARQRGAFNYLYDNYSGVIFGVTLRVLGDRGLAEDATQEVFVKIWNHIDKYDPEKSGLYAWMVKVARNHAIDKIRAKGHYLKWEKGGEVNPDTAPAPGNEASVDSIGMDKLVGRLEEDHQQIIDILFYKGYTHTEAAEALNLPLGTVKSRVRRAVLELRKYFS